jgi:hypothetical protein
MKQTDHPGHAFGLEQFAGLDHQFIERNPSSAFSLGKTFY